ncbi:hypothetical protein AVEN_262100-1 [Araneus ventricosus]|uniref:Uncharacterized protein n=1 Tax=Araneus ventricosus TaxID=182803 RepID=A0A4Y2BMH8_ARAVE|nr:hypothetical protein AVEN_262100-1 [Araneus ventricosus]
MHGEMNSDRVLTQHSAVVNTSEEFMEFALLIGLQILLVFNKSIIVYITNLRVQTMGKLRKNNSQMMQTNSTSIHLEKRTQHPHELSATSSVVSIDMYN